jgi:hypothetical protein
MVEGHPNVQIPPLALYVLAASQADGRAYILSFLLTSTSLEFLGPHILTGFRERAHDFGHPSFLTPAYVQRLTQSVPKKYRWMVEAVIRMIHALRSCMEILAREPILVDSGRYQPKYQRRMYADMEGEIVNELSSKLPNYHAKVRLLSGEEHLIRTNPAPQGLTEDLLIDRMTRIKRQMRVSGYVREVREVEEEVRKRHEQLRRPVQEPPRRRHTGEPRPRRTG